MKGTSSVWLSLNNRRISEILNKLEFYKLRGTCDDDIDLIEIMRIIKGSREEINNLLLRISKLENQVERFQIETTQ